MKPLIACFSHLCNDTYITGAEKLLLFMLRELSIHYTCVLIVPNRGLLSTQAASYGIRCLVEPCPLWYEMVHPSAALFEQLNKIRQLPEWTRVNRLLRQLRPDYVLVNTSVHVLPALAAKEQRLPVLWQITELIHTHPHTAQAIQLIHNHADAIIGISDTTLEPFRQFPADRASFHYKLPPSWHMESLEPAAWPDYRLHLRQRLGLQETHCLIGYISSAICEHKGLEHFVQMGLILLSSCPDAHFLIVGKPHDEAYMHRCLQLIQQAGRADRFHLIGFEGHIQSFYPAMDIVVIPSLMSEGFGMTALEGMLFGKPVVSYHSGGLAEIHEAAGSTRYLAGRGDVHQLVQLVTELALHPDERINIGLANARSGIEAFGIDAYRARLHQLFLQFTIARHDVFSRVRGSSNIVYVRRGNTFRLMRSLRSRAALRSGRPRRISDHILQALPIQPYGTRSEKGNVPSRLHKRRSRWKRRRQSPRNRSLLLRRRPRPKRKALRSTRARKWTSSKTRLRFL